ncbi:hypothetical protein ASPVEDRAFT_684657 [Aspergillus versicolor CBS 583.65]|uniref:Uncharacterized protein n=1 Tax=Aspergillus versicolor CBS 583.65 TaxID=1036611 RepID=A0A1L9PME2_ASPVE|nr:uncharacterized protein ASPVEDRAFT_684657 [Aspergillus versicolor CBS 583.65]OJJ02606.1 hypothetical protein ASPVEDRAFT_684657 [Aspergillus versicolor CBS 583.65]
MSIREKVRKVFRGHKSKQSASGIKIEYYRRGEVPPSKFKGPFDKEHQKQLAAWSFEEAQKDRRRSLDLSLSPCTTLPDYVDSRGVADTALDQTRPRIPKRNLSHGASPAAYHDEFIQDRQATEGSLSSTTAVDPESFSDSTMTLFLDPLDEDPGLKGKNPVRNTSPIIRSVATPPLPAKGAPIPFAADDLTRALNAVQICS